MNDTTRTAIEFFMDHAGYAKPPGRMACARGLAKAEAALTAAIRAGTVRVRWEPDEYDDDECDALIMRRIESGEWEAAGCILETKCSECGAWQVRADLWGIVGPVDDPYRRVVEAELAEEAKL